MPLESYCYTRISIGAPHPHKELHVAPLTVRAERELTLADPLMDIRLPPLIMAVRIQSLCLYSTAAADVSVRHFFHHYSPSLQRNQYALRAAFE